MKQGPYFRKCVAACGPQLSFDVWSAGLGWRGKGTPGQAAALRLGGRRVAPTPLRCSVSWPRRRTHSATCGRCVRTASTSQKTKRAARAATSPGLAGRAGPGGPAVRKAQAVHWTACVPAHLLGTSEARLRLPGRAFAEPAPAAMREPGMSERQQRAATGLQWLSPPAACRPEIPRACGTGWTGRCPGGLRPHGDHRRRRRWRAGSATPRSAARVRAGSVRRLRSPPP